MIRVILGPRAKKRFQSFTERASFSKKDRMLMDAFLERAEWLKKDPQIGIRIPKRQIPKRYRQVDVSSLLLLKLPLFWRMLYTIRIDDDRIVLVLDILSHKEYDALFGYRKK